jgi:hypothetical protein
MVKLRAVQPDEPARRPMTVTKAAATGDRRDLLVALRARIAQSVEDPNTRAPALAALSRRLLEIARELEALDAEGGGDAVGNAAATPDERWAFPQAAMSDLAPTTRQNDLLRSSSAATRQSP